MSEDQPRHYIDEIVGHPHFERIRAEILGNVDRRLRESHEAFTGLATFSGILYSGGVVASLGFIGSQIGAGLTCFAIASFVLMSSALCVFAICYHQYSQLMAARSWEYSSVAHDFFTRQATIEDVINAGSGGEAPRLFKVIFWVPFLLAVASITCGALGLLLLESPLPPAPTQGV